MTQIPTYNRLKDEKSLYLKQHENNPVHWWPYGPEAIQRAKDEDKPIFMSIGYSTCHWCHVMAHESFENQEVADYLNENYISIKVDREEYPDIDQYYQQACQMFMKSGGWPLSVFLLPDLRPYFVGTYFPLEKTTEDRVTFPEILKELKRAYTDEKDKVLENADKIVDAILQEQPIEDKPQIEGHFPAPSAILEAIKEYRDEEFGSYGASPKFPHFAFHEWQVDHVLEGMVAPEHLEHTKKSIERMLMGGIFDHARGGIHRYSVDEKWLVPHFEKMLYDQAGLLSTLSKFSLIHPSPVVFDALINTLDYLENEMLSEKNYFFSAQDADSEGAEGLYFTYTLEEFEDVVNSIGNEEIEAKLDSIKEWFQITNDGNFKNNLNVISLDYTKRNEIQTQENWDMVRKIRNQIIESRKERIPPATDTKGVASWNFLLINGLLDIIQYAPIDVIRNKAFSLFDKSIEGIHKEFILEGGQDKNAIRHTNTKETTLPYLEDYVFFAEIQLKIYEMTANETFKDNLRKTLDFIQREFIKEDKVYTRAISSDDHELYPNQVMKLYDSSFKSPLATLISVFRRSAVLFQEPELLTPLEKIIDDSISICLRNPIACGEGLKALTYPDNVYRVLKVPKAWVTNQTLLSIRPYFLSRFVMDYTDETEEWQVCNLEQCELKGNNVEELKNALMPKQNKPEDKNEQPS